MINLVVGGATGKLGKVVCALATASEDIEVVGGTASKSGGNIGKEIAPGIRASAPEDLKKLLDDADVYVDLTTPSAASKIIADIPSTGTNIIVGTTAVDKGAIAEMTKNIEKYGTSGIVSANFAKGVNVFWKMCEVLAKSLPDYDIEVVETHHHFKKDAPSGTAMEAAGCHRHRRAGLRKGGRHRSERKGDRDPLHQSRRHLRRPHRDVRRQHGDARAQAQIGIPRSIGERMHRDDQMDLGQERR